MYNVDWGNIIRQSCPPRIYKSTIVAWLSVLVEPIQRLHALFIDYSDDISYKLNHNSQVCYLSAALNDELDLSLRRIYIADAGGYVIQPINRDTDEEPVLLCSDTSGDALILQPDSGYSGGSYDFIVVLPYTFPQSSIYRLRSLIDYYKLAGKRYDILVA